MAVTVASIQEFAPEFADTDDALIQTFIDQAALFVSSAAWSTRYDTGLTYLTLHMLTLWYRAQPAAGAAAGTGGSADAGPVKWRQVDNMQIGYSSPASAVGAQAIKPRTDSWYESTAWGSAYATMRRHVFSARVF